MNLQATILYFLSSLLYHHVNCINILNEQQQVHSMNSIAHQDYKHLHASLLSPSTSLTHQNNIEHLRQHFSNQEQDLDNNINHLVNPLTLQSNLQPSSPKNIINQDQHLKDQHPKQQHQQQQQQQQLSSNFHSPHHQSQQQKKANSAMQSQSLNKLTKYLNAGQLRLIERNPGSLMAVARALKMATAECHWQMRNEPWDCPIYGFSARPTEMFGMLMSRSFKETSFIQSLLSSALAHSITRACTESTITTCEKKQSLNNKNLFIENTDFGINFAREFMELAYDKSANSMGHSTSQAASGDILSATGSNNNNNIDHHHQQFQIQTTSGGYEQQPISKEKRLRQLINKHNDEVGRLMIIAVMKRECKCHGLSGACTIQTCWDRLPNFREVADKLHERLNKALRVTKDINIPLTSHSLTSSKYKSLTSSPTKKSNKKRSSSSQPLPSIEGFGRSTSPSIKTSINHYGAAIRSGSDIVGGGVGVSGAGTVGRLQAYHETMNNVAANTGGGNNFNNPAANGMDGQLSIEFIGTNNNPASMMMNQPTNTTVVKKRPVARSIGVTAPNNVNKLDLLYAEESPDFCMPSESYNIKGTKGRVCSENEKDNNSCKRLCCDRGYKTEIREEKFRCGCKFKFCCELECNICTRRKVIHKCL